MNAPARLRDLATRGTVHFMGIGGAGMAPLARMLHRDGVRVTGCDLHESRAMRALAELGIPCFRGHDPAHLQGAALLVFTAAIPDDHPELEAARDLGIPALTRARALGQWIDEGRVVAIAGTHGKTTTTAMTTTILEAGGLDPTGVVGGEVEAWGGNLRPGDSELFVVEADEYDRSFLELNPSIAAITNLEADHLDIYSTLAGVRAAFADFVGRLAPDGVLWVCGDDSGAAAAGVRAGERTRSYGLAAGAQLRAVDLRSDDRGSRFDIVAAGVRAGRFRIAAPGLHNVRNALAAVGVARTLGVAWGAVREGLDAFRGVARRYDLLGSARGVQVVDDYAHHPTEIAATLSAARATDPRGRLVAVFQPHLFTRTRDFHRDFARALGAADRIWVTDIYPAREAPIPGVTGEMIATAVQGGSARVTYHPELDTLADALAADLNAGDLCVLMGAGSIETTGPQLLSTLREGAAGQGGGGR